MASYDELYDLANNTNLLRKVTSAVAVQADVIRAESGGISNHALRLVWAKEAYEHPDEKAKQMIWAVLAANKSTTKAQIEAATDAAILANVATFVDLFAA